MPAGPTPAAQTASSGAVFPKLPPEIRDEAFDRYVNLLDLAGDWLALNAPGLADCGLQLAEGESVLLRTHRGGYSSAMVLGLAIKAAAAKRDQQTLDRVKRYAEQKKDPGLTAVVDTALKGLAAEDPDAALLRVSADEMTVEQFAEFKGAVNVLRHARLDNNANMLAELEKRLPTLNLPSPRKIALRAAMTTAKSGFTKRYHAYSGPQSVSPMNRLLQACEANGRDCLMRAATCEAGGRGCLMQALLCAPDGVGCSASP